MFYRNIFKWESQFLRPRLLKVSLSFWDRDWDSQKSVSVSRTRLGNSWWLRPRLGYEQFSRPRQLETGPWMWRPRPRQRVLLISDGWVGGLIKNKANLSPAKLKLSWSWAGAELGKKIIHLFSIYWRTRPIFCKFMKVYTYSPHSSEKSIFLHYPLYR